MSNWISVKEAAKRLERSVPWIHALIQRKDSRLKVERVGYSYLISAASVEAFIHRPPGNPGHKKTKPRKLAKQKRVSKRLRKATS